MKRNFLLLILIIAVMLCNNSYTQIFNPNALDGEIYVKFKNEFPLNVPFDEAGNIDITHFKFLNKFVAEYGITRVYKSFYFAKDFDLLQTLRIEFTEKAKIDGLIRALSQINQIEYAEPVPLLMKCLTPNDMGTNSQANGTWGLYKINAQQAWDISTGNPNIVVGIVDDAVETAHPDLAPNMLPGWDVALNTNNPNPPSTAYSHGTHVAGISAAATNNGIGVASIGYSVKILPVKSTNQAQYVTHGYEGVTWAANNGADVINMSWGGTTNSSTAQNVINSAYNAGVFLVAAAGNTGDQGNPIFYPAAYTNTLAVASTTFTDAKASYSQYGTWIDVSAPGSSIRSAIPFGTYGIKSGTSMASPLVAGLAALMLSVDPTLTNVQLKSCLQSSCDNIDAQNPSFIGQIGAGRINAYQALLCVNVPVNPLDAGISQIISPAPTTCTGSITPSVKIKNFGQTTLTSATIRYRVDNGAIQNFSWIGNLTTGNEATVNLPNITVTAGAHTFLAYTHNPNNGTDGNNSNDTAYTNFHYYATGGGLPFLETFESGNLTTNSWGIYNPDNGITWEVVTTQGTTPGNKSARMNFYNYNAVGQRDALLTKPLNFSGYSSIQLTFEHAYRRQSQASTDSLNIYVSTNCGLTFPHKVLAAGENGQGVFATAATSTTPFTPSVADDWCISGSVGASCFNVNLNQFIGQQNVVVKFEAYNSKQNNLFLDNINITGTPSGNPPPVANFVANQTNITVGQSVNFTDLSTNNPTSWSWTFQGGVPASSNLQNPTNIVYNTAGNYTVTLQATNAAGSHTETKTAYIKVNPPSGQAPIAQFVASATTINAGQSVNFTDQSLYNPTSWSWTFQGATPSSSTLQNPTNIVYNTPGIYDVRLYVINAFGNDLELKTQYITVLPPNNTPIANFVANQTNINVGQSVNFTDLSTNNPTSWSWIFSGGVPITSTSQNPSNIVYNTAGVYNVSLQASNAFGNDTETKVGYIKVNASNTAPIANFVASSTNISAGTSINFTDLSVNNPTSWLWQFESAVPASSTVQNPTGIFYANPGTYYVTLIASNAYGTGFENKTLYINVGPASIEDMKIGGFIQVYPNPTNDLFNVEILSETNDVCDINLYNVLGQNVYSISKYEINTGKNLILLDVSSLSKGIYYLEIDTKGKKYMHKTTVY